MNLQWRKKDSSISSQNINKQRGNFYEHDEDIITRENIKSII